jgi:site-specific recombinase XerD
LREQYPKTFETPLLSDLPHINRVAVRVIKMLNDLYIHGVIIRKRHAFSKDGLTKNDRLLIEELEQYVNNNHSKKSAMRISNDMKSFLRFLNNKDVMLSDCKDEDVTAYLLASSTNSKSLLSARQYSLKVFLKFLHTTRRHENDLSGKFSMVRVAKHPRIPSVWIAEDVIKTLKAVDRGSPLGKRDYAILMLVVRLGLRISDVKTLRLTDVKWDENRIELNQSKTGNPLSLPLLPDVGWAIIDYLKHGRPESDLQQIFLTAVPPIREISLTSSMANVVAKYARIGGVTLRPNMKHGMHSLRHSLASRLLEAKTPLPIISEVLGHASPHEVNAYLKVDIENLRRCALNPEEVFSDAKSNRNA